MHIVTAKRVYNNLFRTPALYQYDYGQVLKIEDLELPEVYEVHFSNSQNGSSTTSIGTSSGVIIPDMYLQSGKEVFAWIYLHDENDDGETVYRISIPVKPRASITDQQPTPVQQDTITQAIAALNAGVTEVENAVDSVDEVVQTALAEAKASGMFDGIDGVDGRDGIDGLNGKDGKDGRDGVDGVNGVDGADGRDGVDGADGRDGTDGQDGFSPVVSVSEITGGHRVEIIDANGIDSFDVMDGAPGLNGADGIDGHSPSVTATKSGITTTIKVDGDVVATILDGVNGVDGKDGRDGNDGQDGVNGVDGHSPVVTASKSGTVTTVSVDGEPIATINDGDPTSLIDDTAGDGVTNRTWSADKLDETIGNLNTAIGEKYTKPGTGIPASDLASGVIPSVPVQDVQVSGTSILDQGVANIPIANADVYGVIKYSSSGSGGLKYSSSTGRTTINNANGDQIRTGTETYRPITPSNQHMSVFYGLSTVAGDSTQASSGNTVGVYTDSAKVAIQKMLGIYRSPWELIIENTVTNETESPIFISVDGNGNAFDLTDLRLLFWTPAQETTAIIGGWGAVSFFKNSLTIMSTNVYNTSQNKVVNPSDSRCCGFIQIECDGGMAFLSQYNLTNVNSAPNIVMKAYVDPTLGYYPFKLNNSFSVDKVKIHNVTGTLSYRLYGRRKWT